MWWKLTYKQKLLAIYVFFLLAKIRCRLVFLPFKHATWHLLDEHMQPNLTKKKLGYAKAIGRIIAWVAKFTPWQSKCLAQALCCRKILRYFAIPSTFYIGVNYDENGKFISHAWLNCKEITIIGGSDSFESYSVIKKFVDDEITT